MTIKHSAVILLLALAAASASVATPEGFADEGDGVVVELAPPALEGFSDGADGLVAELAPPALDAPLPSSGG
jgi:hypothetical protein